MNKNYWNYKHLHSSELWDMVGEILTELSRRDEVEFKVAATPESVERKIKSLL